VTREIGNAVQVDHRLVAVAGVVDAHDVEVAQRICLWIPHVARRAKRAGEDHRPHRR
jgi:hypothetical protein